MSCHPSPQAKIALFKSLGLAVLGSAVAVVVNGSREGVEDKEDAEAIDPSAVEEDFVEKEDSSDSVEPDDASELAGVPVDNVYFSLSTTMDALAFFWCQPPRPSYRCQALCAATSSSSGKLKTCQSYPMPRKLQMSLPVCY